MEFLLQYNASINYIPGDKNCAADALSQLPADSIHNLSSVFTPAQTHSSSSKLEIDTSILNAIKDGYATNPFIEKLTSTSTGMDSIQEKNGFWFINKCLVIPSIKNVREYLFHLAHDVTTSNYIKQEPVLAFGTEQLQ